MTFPVDFSLVVSPVQITHCQLGRSNSSLAFFFYFLDEFRRVQEPLASPSRFCTRITVAGCQTPSIPTSATVVAKDPVHSGPAIGLFEKTVWPVAVAGAAARAASQGPRIDVGARMRGMWRGVSAEEQ
jgi:hypothetical protein